MKATWVGGAVLAIIAIVLALLFWRQNGAESEIAQPVVPEAPAVESDVVVEDEGVVVDEPPAEDATESEQAATEPDAPTSSAAVYDIVRVEPDGETVIAGRATPGSKIVLKLDGEVVGESQADAVGNFVALLSLGVSDLPRVLTLTETLADGSVLEADGSLILAPSPKIAEAEVTPEPSEAVAEIAESATEDAPGDSTETDLAASDAAEAETNVETAETEAVETPVAETMEEEAADVTEVAEADVAQSDENETAQEMVVVVEADATANTDEASDDATVEVAETQAPVVESIEATAPAPAPETPAAPAAPTVLLADSEGVRVVQSGGDAPQVLDNVSIDAISYDSAGEVALTGRSSGQSSVRVYLDNAPILDTEIGEDGQWRADLPEIDTGTYTLRVDELDAEGVVVSRTETPFRREPVEAIQALDTGNATQTSPVALITVQPGNTLWGIAREKYGEGLLYVRVFDANADRIRDPDLIYPGQIFTVPE